MPKPIVLNINVTLGEAVAGVNALLEYTKATGTDLVLESLVGRLAGAAADVDEEDLEREYAALKLKGRDL